MQVRLGRNGLVHTFYRSSSSLCSQRLACSSSWVAMHFLLYRRLFRKSKACLIMPLIFSNIWIHMLIYFMLMVLMCMEVSTAAGARSVWLLDYKAGMEQGIVQVEADSAGVNYSGTPFTWVVLICRASEKRDINNTLQNRSNTTERAHNT